MEVVAIEDLNFVKKCTNGAFRRFQLHILADIRLKASSLCTSKRN